MPRFGGKGQTVCPAFRRARRFVSIFYLESFPPLITTRSDPDASIEPTPDTSMVQDEQILFFTVPDWIDVLMVDDPLTRMS